MIWNRNKNTENTYYKEFTKSFKAKLVKFLGKSQLDHSARSLQAIGHIVIENSAKIVRNTNGFALKISTGLGYISLADRAII